MTELVPLSFASGLVSAEQLAVTAVSKGSLARLRSEVAVLLQAISVLDRQVVGQFSLNAASEDPARLFV